jgi:uridine kinase
MPRPIILGVVGDSASGQTTLTRGLVGLLGAEQVSHVLPPVRPCRAGTQIDHAP